MGEEEHLDLVETTDAEGNSLFLRVERYFYYNGDEYVLLRQSDGEGGIPSPEEDRRWVMRVELSRDEDGDEVEDFLPVEEGLMEALLTLASTDFRGEEGPASGGGP